MGSVFRRPFRRAEFGQLAHASSLCGACREAARSDIDLPKLLLRVRAGNVEGNSQTVTESQGLPSKGTENRTHPGSLAFGLRLYTWAAVSAWRFTTAQK